MGLYEHIIIYNIIIVLPLESIFEFVFIAIHKEIWYTPALHQFVFFFMKIGKKIIDICDMIPRFGLMDGTLPLLPRRMRGAAYQRRNHSKYKTNPLNSP